MEPFANDTNMTDVVPPAVGTSAMLADEGNWSLYRNRCNSLTTNAQQADAESQRVRRAFARAYLGRRAQLNGGVYSSSKPSVLTEAVIADLTAANTARRMQRYPWIGQMLSILEELDKMQGSHAGSKRLAGLNASNTNFLTLVH